MVPRNSEDLVLKEKVLHLDIFSIFSWCFIVTYFTFRSMIHFELIVEYGVK